MNRRDPQEPRSLLLGSFAPIVQSTERAAFFKNQRYSNVFRYLRETRSHQGTAISYSSLLVESQFRLKIRNSKTSSATDQRCVAVRSVPLQVISPAIPNDPNSRLRSRFINGSSFLRRDTFPWCKKENLNPQLNHIELLSPRLRNGKVGYSWYPGRNLVTCPP